MPRRVKQSRSLLGPLTDNFVTRLSNADARFRRKAVRFGFWTLGLVFIVSIMSGTYGIPRIVRLELERAKLIDANRRILVELIDNTRVRGMLENDPAYIEYLARTRYHMVSPNETIYYYRDR